MILSNCFRAIDSHQTGSGIVMLYFVSTYIEFDETVCYASPLYVQFIVEYNYKYNYMFPICNTLVILKNVAYVQVPLNALRVIKQYGIEIEIIIIYAEVKFILD